MILVATLLSLVGCRDAGGAAIAGAAPTPTPTPAHANQARSARMVGLRQGVLDQARLRFGEGVAIVSVNDVEDALGCGWLTRPGGPPVAFSGFIDDDGAVKVRFSDEAPMTLADGAVVDPDYEASIQELCRALNLHLPPRPGDPVG